MSHVCESCGQTVDDTCPICSHDPCQCVPMDKWPNCLSAAMTTDPSVKKSNLQIAANKIRELESKVATLFKTEDGTTIVPGDTVVVGGHKYLVESISREYFTLCDPLDKDQHWKSNHRDGIRFFNSKDAWRDAGRPNINSD